MARAITPNKANAGSGLAVAGATDPSAKVVAMGRPGSNAMLSPTWAGTVTPAAESTQTFMFVMVTCAMESRRAESADATIWGLPKGRGGATYVVICAVATLAASMSAALMNIVRTIRLLRLLTEQ